MRFLTIIISVLLGVALCAIFINNGQLVRVNFGPFFSGPYPAMTRTEPLWVVMFVCIGAGLLIGYLFAWLGAPSSSNGNGGGEKPSRKTGDDDVDYLIGVQRKN